MSKISALFLSDEEMGKKDDDHRTQRRDVPAGARLPAWAPARIPPVQPRRLLKRLLVLALAGFVVYVFIANIPTDVPIRDRRRPQYVDRYPSRPPRTAEPARIVRPLDHTARADPDASRTVSKSSSEKPSAKADGKASQNQNSYKGPIRFLELAQTLQAIGETRGAYSLNKNVLFAAASLKSAAALLPIACEMGSELRSYVHFALMTRGDISLRELQKVNGIDESCKIIFHDARPEFASISTETRLGESVAKALHYIYNYMHPQAIIIDNASHEEPYFVRGIRKQTGVEPMSLIELPARGLEKLSWMTKLDSQSLKAWNDINIDILIYANAGGSGSLIRLLKSLKAADYFSSPFPHITIELPHVVDAPTRQFLQSFDWPPVHSHSGAHARQLSLRHRIPRKALNEEQSSARFLESFWPARPDHSHVLILSPDVELSPNFFHYLKYAALTYRYSIAAQVQEWNKHLLGISLASPVTFLNGSGEFQVPEKPESIAEGPSDPDSPTSFLWEAPTSNAVLILGDKWIELHGFVANMLDVQHRMTETPRPLADKLVSKWHPAWLEQALRLCRARGYMTLYPSRPASSQLVTVHTEAYRPPEEYADDLPLQKSRHDRDAADGAVSHTRGPLLDTLPDGGLLPPFYELPMLSWDGSPTDFASFEDQASKYAREFRQTVGGCDSNVADEIRGSGLVEDLFCFS